jgi:hypothetical protein
LEGAIFLKAFHFFPLAAELRRFEDPLRHVRGQLDLKALQTELVLIALLHRLARHLLHSVLRQRRKLFLRNQVLAFFGFSDAHVAVASGCVGDGFGGSDVQNLEGFG